MSAATEYLTFQVHGDYITNLLRDIFLEEGYQKAYDIYAKTFTSELDVKYLNDILECKNKFIGINEFEFVEDSWEDNPEYKRDFDYRFNGLVYHNKKYYKPYAIIASWVHEDFTYAAGKWEGTWKEECYFAPLKRYCRFNEARSYYYVKDNDKKYEIFTENHTVYIFEEVDFDIPYWMCSKFKRSLSDAIDEYIANDGHFNIIDPIKNTAEAEKLVKKPIKDIESITDIVGDNWLDDNKAFREEFASKYVLNAYKEKILTQNGENWVELKYTVADEEKSLKIPAKPFHHWCIGSGRLIEAPEHSTNVKKIVDWDPCSPPGLKMLGDNLYHTDWVIGAGLNPEDWYAATKDDEEYKAIDDAAWKFAFDFCTQLRKKK